MEINKNIVNNLLNCERVAIFIHTNPDGDCLGSASALKQALVSLNKTVDIFSDSLIPENYNFIKYATEIKHDDNVDGYDLHVAVDCSEIKRIGKYSKFFNKIDNTICIDHHKTRVDFAKITHNEIVSSTALIIYYYIKEIAKMDKDIACALYAGISSDTGCFMHSNTTSLEHEISADLINYGFDLYNANENLFKYTTMGKFELNKRALMSAEFFANGKVGIFKLTQKDMTEANADESDTTGLVNQITNVNTCEIGIIIYEKEKGLFRCSLRSKGRVDVANIAEQFGGGGHANAAGCNIFGGLKTAVNKISSVCIKEINKLGL